MGRLDLPDKRRDEDEYHDDQYVRIDASYYKSLRDEVEERKQNERRLQAQIDALLQERAA